MKFSIILLLIGVGLFGVIYLLDPAGSPPKAASDSDRADPVKANPQDSPGTTASVETSDSNPPDLTPVGGVFGVSETDPPHEVESSTDDSSPILLSADEQLILASPFELFSRSAPPVEPEPEIEE